MNRRKKVNQILKKKAKQRTAKLNPKPKSAYVAKAQRPDQTAASDGPSVSE